MSQKLRVVSSFEINSETLKTMKSPGSLDLTDPAELHMKIMGIIIELQCSDPEISSSPPSSPKYSYRHLELCKEFPFEFPYVLVTSYHSFV